MTYSHLDGREADSGVSVFCPPCATTTEPPDASPLAEVTSGGCDGAFSTTKLSGADLVTVRGGLECTDKLAAAAAAVFTSASRVGVSVVLVKLINQLFPLSTMSVCAPDDAESGVSV